MQQLLTAPLNVHWELTNKCNLNCQFCYQRDDEADLQANRRTRDFIIAHRIVDAKVFELTITGGEILLVPYLMELIRSFNERHITPHVTTNGTLISEDIARALASVRISVQISIDSHDPLVHDTLRGRSGSHEDALRGARRLVEHGVDVTLAFTRTKENWAHGAKVVELASRIGVGKVCVGTVMPQFGEFPAALGVELSSEQRIEEQSALEAAKEAHRNVSVQSVLDLPTSSDGAGCSDCSALRRDLAILHDGSAYPCTFTRGDQFRLGSVVTTPIADLWRSDAAALFRRHRESTAMPMCRDVALTRDRSRSVQLVSMARRVERPGTNGR